ncbi:hypothetical protein E4U21_005978 [Claviceps maximensis]|nr:hypothetical protein E4U21_005978 [Claviceps maximensis]
MQRTGPLLVKYVGGTAVTSLSPAYARTMQKANEAVESKVSIQCPLRCDVYTINLIASIQRLLRPEYNLRGSNPHKSSRDKDDDKDVVTVSYHTADGTRVLTVHAHDDSTWKEFPSRNAFKGLR